MKSLPFRLSLAAAAFALATTPAMAQRPNPGGGGDRGGAAASSGGGGDHAVARGSSASAGTTAGDSGSSFGTAGSTSPSSSTFSSAGAPRESAPQRRTAAPRSSAPQSGGDHAVPRSGAASAPAAGSTHVRAGASESSRRTAEGNGDAVPGWARPRNGQPTTGTAVQRTTPYHGDHGYPYYPYYPYSGYYWGYPGYPYGVSNYYGQFSWAFGVGYGLGFPYLYDPWYAEPFYGSGDPFAYGSGDPFVYGGGGYADMGGYGGSASDDEQGSLRLKVKPRDAKVYVDGYLVGSVDEMDGVFQKLPLNGGHHHVQVKADGYATEEFDVMITPGETATFEGDLKRIQ